MTRAAALKADALVSARQRPAVDFAYSYGLLPVWIAHVWYAIFGRTPWGHEGLIATLTLILAAGLGQLAYGLRLSRRGLFLAALAMPISLTAVYLKQTHVMESALLAWALAYHTAGRRNAALAAADRVLILQAVDGVHLWIDIVATHCVALPPARAGIADAVCCRRRWWGWCWRVCWRGCRGGNHCIARWCRCT